MVKMNRKSDINQKLFEYERYSAHFSDEASLYHSILTFDDLSPTTYYVTCKDTSSTIPYEKDNTTCVCGGEAPIDWSSLNTDIPDLDLKNDTIESFF